MNIKHYWSVFCKSASVDKFSNNITLGEVIEEIVLQVPLSEKERFESDIKKDGFIVLPVGGMLVSYLEAEQPNISSTISLECVSPNGQEIKMGEIVLTFGSNKRGRSLANIRDLKISEPGCYRFRLTISENKKTYILGEVPLYININFI